MIKVEADRHLPLRKRPAAVSGSFYPANPQALRAQIQRLLAAAAPAHQRRAKPRPAPPKALIVPHAGYVYSGPIAASAYACLLKFHALIKRIVLFGPAHHVRFSGLASSSAQLFETPLGDLPVDQEAIDAVKSLSGVRVCDEAHAPEHCLEVQLPFLWEALQAQPEATAHSALRVVPLLFGDTDDQQAAEVLEKLWDGAETLIVVSSDLSHYHDHPTARRLDRATADAITEGQAGSIGPEQACGYVAVQALMHTARRHGLSAECVDLRNSGDTSGPKHEVVGYGSFIFC